MCKSLDPLVIFYRAFLTNSQTLVTNYALLQNVLNHQVQAQKQSGARSWSLKKNSSKELLLKTVLGQSRCFERKWKQTMTGSGLLLRVVFVRTYSRTSPHPYHNKGRLLFLSLWLRAVLNHAWRKFSAGDLSIKHTHSAHHSRHSPCSHLKRVGGHQQSQTDL